MGSLLQNGIQIKLQQTSKKVKIYFVPCAMRELRVGGLRRWAIYPERFGGASFDR
jgi:hypothetical protein